MSKIQPVVTRLKNIIRKERTYDVLYNPYKEKAEIVQNILGKSDFSKKKKKKKKKKTCGYRGASISKDG